MEKKIISRREALRRMLCCTGAAIITPSLLDFSNELLGRDLSAVAISSPESEDDFFIRRVAAVLVKKQPKPTGNAAKAPYESNYELYSIHAPGRPSLRGKVRVVRGIDGDSSRMSFEVVRMGSQGHNQYIKINQKVKPGLPGTPVSWEYDARLAPASDAMPRFGIPLQGRGTASDGNITIHEHDGKIVKQFTASPEFVLSWSVLDTVRQVAQQPETPLPLKFDTINEYDMYGGPKQLFRYKSTRVEYGGKTHKLECYLLAGEALVPNFYWVNEDGELLFMNSGMEVLILV